MNEALKDYIEEDQPLTLEINVDPKKKGNIDLTEADSLSFTLKNITTTTLPLITISSTVLDGTTIWMTGKIPGGNLKPGKYKVRPYGLYGDDVFPYPGDPAYITVIAK